MTPALRNRGLLIGGVVLAVAIGWVASVHGTDQAASEPAAVAAPPRPVATIYWQDITGMNLPISSEDGPRCLTRTRAQCFARTTSGAAIAAAHILTRTFAFVGPASFGPTIRDQVVGDGQATLLRLTTEVHRESAAAEGGRLDEPLTYVNGWLVGYHLLSTTGGNEPTGAVVDVLFRQNDVDGETFASFTVTVEWRSGDWRLVAPPWGDWRTAATPVDSPDPDYYRTFDSLGVPA